MNVLWNKIWFDLWHNKLRTFLVVISITVGVFAVGTTFGMVDLMLPTMDAANRSTNPGHVTMNLTQLIDRDIVIGLKQVPGVEDVEPMNGLQISYKLHPGDEWHNGNLYMRDDYRNQIYDLLQLKGGQWPEGQNLSIERMHSPFYGIYIGDSVILDVNNQERSFPISGIIRHPFVPPPSMYDLAWFFSGPDVMEKFGIPLGKFNQIKFRVVPYSDENARQVASLVKERLAKQGIGVAATVYQDPNKHWGRVGVEGMNLIMEVMAVISLLLSMVLVLNTLTAIITQQTNQIGILKAVGGSSAAITRLYLTGVLVYGLLSLCIALPLGVFASYQATRWFLGFYNIEYQTFSYSRLSIAFQILAAIAVPLVAALWPVMQGARITIRQAIAAYGLGGEFGSSWVDRAIESLGMRFLAPYQAIALANTFRRKGRLMLTQLVLVIAGAMFLMMMSLSSSLTSTLDNEFGRRRQDVEITFQDLQRVDRTEAMVQALPGVDRAVMYLGTPVTILQKGQKKLDAGMGSQLLGVPVVNPIHVPMIAEGRWLEPGDSLAVVMNKDTADNEHIRLGDTITLDLGEAGSGEWRVVGLYRMFSMFGGGYAINNIYAPCQAVYDASNKAGKGNLLLVAGKEHTEAASTQLAGNLKELFQQQNVDIALIETMAQTRKTLDNTFIFMIGMFLALACIVALVGGIGLMGSLSISVIERTKEIGVMRAIGASSANILSIFLIEGVVQGLISWAIAVPLSMLVAPTLAHAMGLAMFKAQMDYQYNYGAVWIWLGVILVVAVLASVIPSYSATRVNVRQSITYE